MRKQFSSFDENFKPRHDAQSFSNKRAINLCIHTTILSRDSRSRSSSSFGRHANMYWKRKRCFRHKMFSEFQINHSFPHWIRIRCKSVLVPCYVWQISHLQMNNALHRDSQWNFTSSENWNEYSIYMIWFKS